MSRRRKALFVPAALLLGLLVGLTLLEFGLRAAGFSYRLYPERIEFGWPDPQALREMFVEDEELFWVLEDYRQRLDPPGIVGPTLVLMGDSCTELGNYDMFLARMMRQRFPRWRESFVKVAVSGYSSYQGLRQFERDVVPLEPRVVTILYGWNDHWVGFGIEDKQVAQLKSRTPSRLESLRLVQLTNKAGVSLIARESADVPARVSPDDYRRNLEGMIELARSNQIIPVLLTAPTSHRRGREPEHLAERHLPDLGRLVPVHREYNDIVRDVAHTRGVVLCDMAATFSELPGDELEQVYFWEDGVHMRQVGNRFLAERLFECLERSDLLHQLVF